MTNNDGSGSKGARKKEPLIKLRDASEDNEMVAVREEEKEEKEKKKDDNKRKTPRPAGSA